MIDSLAKCSHYTGVQRVAVAQDGAVACMLMAF
jgi:hypothetical protein